MKDDICKNIFINIKKCLPINLSRYSVARLKHDWKVEHNMVGYNLRMANINTALGYGQIIDFDKIIQKKRDLYQRYCNVFEDNKFFYIKKSDNKCNNNWVTNLYLKDEYLDRHQTVIKSLHSHKLFVRELWEANAFTSYV